MSLLSIEEIKIKRFLEASSGELFLDEFMEKNNNDLCYVGTLGFEERCVAVLERLAKYRVALKSVIIGAYSEEKIENNAEWKQRMITAGNKICNKGCKFIPNKNDGMWVYEALKHLTSATVIFDISTMSSRSLFTSLDAILKFKNTIYIAYSEAGEYWPKEEDWLNIKSDLSDPENIAEKIGQQPWLFGYEHIVELMPGYEGYDSGTAGRALISFLSFKPARLQALLNFQDFRDMRFIAGIPRLKENFWRLEAQKEINRVLTTGGSVTELTTFGYRNTIVELKELLFNEEARLIYNYDINLAIIGSKLQTLGCYIVANLLPSITIVTSSPQKYFSAAFSESYGQSWIFPLNDPKLFT